nr:tripartite motif-containing protein 15-like [Pelodiscus sinensis]|eukprot:XP_025040101.1 tripartite motif-containing protein 15-like [Pelodiscus sinensis]
MKEPWALSMPLTSLFPVFTQKWTQAKRQMIVAEFQQLQQFLEEQERLLLTQLEKLDEEIGRFQTDTIRNLSMQISRLSEQIGELEGTCQKPANEFLQDVRSALSRCETGQFQLPEISPELEEQVRGFSQKTIALSETLRKFKGTWKGWMRGKWFNYLRLLNLASEANLPLPQFPCGE